MRYLVIIFLFFFFNLLHSQVATTIEDFFLPGSQPLQSGDLGSPASCSCHDGYDINVEPHFNWEGSMMAQAMRDQLFIATMAIAIQDADSCGELCLRCHTPTGWLSGRSDPPDGSALIAEDYTSVNCLYCHRSLMPSEITVNPYPLDLDYINPDYTTNIE